MFLSRPHPNKQTYNPKNKPPSRLARTPVPPPLVGVGNVTRPAVLHLSIYLFDCPLVGIGKSILLLLVTPMSIFWLSAHNNNREYVRVLAGTVAIVIVFYYIYSFHDYIWAPHAAAEMWNSPPRTISRSREWVGLLAHARWITRYFSKSHDLFLSNLFKLINVNIK